MTDEEMCETALNAVVGAPVPPGKNRAMVAGNLANEVLELREFAIAAIARIAELERQVAEAREKAAQYERDWYDAKSEFGTAMAKMKERCRADVAEAEQRGRDAERADVVAHLRQSAADLRSLGAFDSDQTVEDECDDIEAGRHVGAGKGET